MIVSLAGRMTLRDWRAGELNFLLIALMIAVASLASVGFLSDRMRAGLEQNAHQLLASDLLISADQPLAPEWKEKLASGSLQTAETAVFPSMAFSTDQAQPAARLVSLKAVSASYPLRGSLKIRDEKNQLQTAGAPPAGSVWVDQSLLYALNLQIGQPLRLGDQTLRISAVIENEPDRGAGFMNFAPRAMIAMSDLAATGLIQDGSRVTYRLLVAGDQKAVANLQQQWQVMLDKGKYRGIRMESWENGRPEMRTTLDRAEQFLSLVSLLASLLAALAIAMAANRYMQRHLDAVAMLRCLGLTQTQATTVFALEFLALAIAGSVAGVALGYAGHLVLIRWLGDLLTTDLPPASTLTALKGLLTGIVLLAGFAMPQVLRLRKVPHTHVIRRQLDSGKQWLWGAYATGLLAMLGLMVWHTGQIRMSLLLAAGFVIAGGIFALAARLLLLALGLLRHRLPFQSWRFAVNNLLRRRMVTVVQMVSLSLGLTALLLLTVVRQDLLAAWRQASPPDAPNHFVLNVQPEQKSEIAGRLAEFQQAPMYPMIRGRLTAVNDKTVNVDDYAADQAKRLVDREFNLSTSNTLPAANQLTAGKWFEPYETSGASVEEGLAKTLGLKLYDKLQFDVAGEKFEVKITSLRKVDWASMRVNFFVLLTPDVAESLPQSWISAFHVKPEQMQRVSQLSSDFPNLTVVDSGAMVRQVQDVLNQVIAAVEFLFLFALLSGMLVLYAALAGSLDVRQQESALLRALGATKKQLQRAQWLEFSLLGMMAGILAALTASAIGWMLATVFFEFEWHFSLLPWAVGMLAGVSCSLLAAGLGLQRILTRPPVASLREAN